MAPPTAADRVFCTPELLEIILSYLPPLQILTTARLVTPFFNSVIKTSPLLRHVTWRTNSPIQLATVPHGNATYCSITNTLVPDYFALNPLLQALFSSVWRWMSYHPPTFYSPANGTALLEDGLGHIPDVYLTHPPVEQMTVSVKDSGRYECAFHVVTSSPGGVTFHSLMRKIGVSVWQLVDKHMQIGGKEWNGRSWYGPTRSRPPRHVVIQLHVEDGRVGAFEKSLLERQFHYNISDKEGTTNVGRVTAMCKLPLDVLVEEGIGGMWEDILEKEVDQWWYDECSV